MSVCLCTPEHPAVHDFLKSFQIMPTELNYTNIVKELIILGSFKEVIQMVKIS